MQYGCAEWKLSVGLDIKTALATDWVDDAEIKGSEPY